MEESLTKSAHSSAISRGGGVKKIIMLAMCLILLSGCIPPNTINNPYTIDNSYSPSTIDSSYSPNNVPSSNLESEKVVTIKEGEFLFWNIKFSKESSSDELWTSPSYFRVNGYIQNRTDKDWKTLCFKLLVYGPLGEKIGDKLIKFDDFKVGEVREYSESCFITKHPPIARYDILLDSGKYPTSYVFSFLMVKPEVSKGLLYEDKTINIIFEITRKQIDFTIYNKISEPIKIDWDSASYVDIFQKSHKIIHKGIKLIERESHQSPTVIPPTASLDDIIYPTDYVSYNDGWVESPLFPETPEAKLYKEMSFSVFLPVLVGSQTKNYLFTFKIDEVVEVKGKL